MIATPIRLIARATLLETIRRREFYVLFIFMGLFLCGAAVARIVGIENAATGTFILDLGLSLAVVFAYVIAVLTAARQVPDESEARTIYPLLAKPVPRGQYLVAKWLAATATGLGTLLILGLMGWLPSPRMETYYLATLAQGAVLAAAGLGAVAAIAILTSLFIPKLLNAVLLLMLVLWGGTTVAFIRNRAAGNPVVDWLTGYIPDFRYFNLTHAYTGGAPPLALADFALRLSYGAALAAVCLAVALYFFNRRPL